MHRNDLNPVPTVSRRFGLVVAFAATVVLTVAFVLVDPAVAAMAGEVATGTAEPVSPARSLGRLVGAVLGLGLIVLGVIALARRLGGDRSTS